MKTCFLPVLASIFAALCISASAQTYTVGFSESNGKTTKKEITFGTETVIIKTNDWGGNFSDHFLNVVVAGGTASSNDYTIPSNWRCVLDKGICILPFATTKDLICEYDETVIINISSVTDRQGNSATNLVLGNTQHTIVIQDSTRPAAEFGLSFAQAKCLKRGVQW